jgi:uncharacterized integral membrane protein
MSILRWIMLTALLVAFLLLSVANWTPVPFRLPDGAIVSVRLPLLLGLAFVAGWLPTWLYHLGAIASFKRKATRTGGKPDALPGTSTLPSQAQPTIVPPAGA